ncbi:MAG: glycoside hydrolase family 16 protein [Bacillales bacterium]|jgi:beta-glucanase (GH16 family)|nr:glycoside hydrolase family 16 protein [Bacillales bacterium]
MKATLLQKIIIGVEILVLFAVVLTFSLISLQGRRIPNKSSIDLSTFELSWSDEFDTLDTTKWKINNMDDDNNLRRAGYYHSEAVKVSDGNLIITTEYKDNAWWTGWVETSTAYGDFGSENYEGFSTTYGYFEVRAIAPKAVGIWSAFWMMPDNNNSFSDNDEQFTATDGCEVDIMESPYLYLGDFVGNKVTHVLHADSFTDNLKSSSSPTYYVEDMYSTFHRYGLEWNENEMIFYIDGYETWRTNFIYRDADGKEHILNVPQVAEYLILSVEVAGTNENVAGNVKINEGLNLDGSAFWSGNPNKNNKDKSYDFVVDYVRVYKKK